MITCEYHYGESMSEYKAMSTMACITAVCCFAIMVEQCLGFMNSGKSSSYSGTDTSFDSYM